MGHARKNGRPEPFKLRYVEIGNEDNLQNGTRTYDERYMAFYNAIKAKYPDLNVIATTRMRSHMPDVLDDHFYNPAANVMRQSTRYDNRPRSDTKIFMGEWASQEGRPTPNMMSALGDAAFLGGLERNSDLVVMECYAPLLVNVNRGGLAMGHQFNWLRRPSFVRIGVVLCSENVQQQSRGPRFAGGFEIGYP